MSNMIKTAPGFQYSVNIAFDLNNDDKIKNFIPTASSITLLDNIIKSVDNNGTDRARILIGPYGKGKSHIVLMILSMLMKKDPALFSNLQKKIKERPMLVQAIKNYYDSDKKILPVIISGSSTSLPQAFLLALHRTLSENGMLDIMPDTNYRAAVSTILKWKEGYPDTYERFCENIALPIDEFVASLNDYDLESYEVFERIYPELTAGSVFNPFVGFDVVELYENVLKALKEKYNYTGLYVVYDEFSKFLESNIKTASTSDTNMLQSFAEKCNRSGSSQLHLMLISHKEIENYIDQLPKNKIDGWRGVSERFTHVILNNNFKQMYEIISSVIQRDEKQYDHFVKNHTSEFDSLYAIYREHNLFADLEDDEFGNMLYKCYPLHPMSMFILPRLSEKVAQNERTLFTFLSADGDNTLSAYLNSIDQNQFKLVTPDMLYDYFEPLFKKEVYDIAIHDNYYLTSVILDKLEAGSLESKIVKAISLIYILDQFDKLVPTKAELYQAYSYEYSKDEIDSTITDLIEKQLVIYLRKSNNYLRLKQTSGVDIRNEILETVEKQKDSLTIKDSLNNSNFDNYLYPSRYNDENEITRFFVFDFINDSELFVDGDWNQRTKQLDGDGAVYGIIPSEQYGIREIEKKVKEISQNCTNAIFVIPKEIHNKGDIIREYEAVKQLMDSVVDDKILFEEYEVVYEDLREIVLEYISDFVRPEKSRSKFLFNGKVEKLSRKASLTELMSRICDELYPDTPVINNESINRKEITSIALNSRNKIVAGLLRTELEPNLGLSGTGQEVSIMRSTLVNKGILINDEDVAYISTEVSDVKMRKMLNIIQSFIFDVKKNGRLSFSELYLKLTDSSYGIGIRFGVIPIYLAAVFHNNKKEIVLCDVHGQVPLNVDTINQINSHPEMFYLEVLDWNSDKEEYINGLADIFAEYVNEVERSSNAFDFVASAIKRWYINLPKYSKECRKKLNGQDVYKTYYTILKALSKGDLGQKLLFEIIPDACSTKDLNECTNRVREFRNYYDSAIDGLISRINDFLKDLFCSNKKMMDKMSLPSVIMDWCEQLDSRVFEQLFTDGTDRCLNLFKNITNDEVDFIKNLSRLATDLRIEDWTEETFNTFKMAIEKYKKTAESFTSGDDEIDADSTANSYQVSFVSEDGSVVTKRFERTETTKRGELLLNQIQASLDSMGQSISEQEKRQILMDILNKLC